MSMLREEVDGDAGDKVPCCILGYSASKTYQYVLARL